MMEISPQKQKYRGSLDTWVLTLLLSLLRCRDGMGRISIKENPHDNRRRSADAPFRCGDNPAEDGGFPPGLTLE